MFGLPIAKLIVGHSKTQNKTPSSIMQLKNEKPASVSKSMASCLPSICGRVCPRRMSNVAVGTPLARMHFEIHASPPNTSMNP